jgi:ActR/RegA family two-component response regulator
MLFASSLNEEAMPQNPVIMEHIKQVLQLTELNVPIKEIARRFGFIHNSIRN